MWSDYDSDATLPLSDAEGPSSIPLHGESAALSDETLSLSEDSCDAGRRNVSDSEETLDLSDTDMSSPLRFGSPPRLSPPTSPTVSTLNDLSRERQVVEYSAGDDLGEFNIVKATAKSPIIVLSDDSDYIGTVSSAPPRNSQFLDLTVDAERRERRSSPSSGQQLAHRDLTGPSVNHAHLSRGRAAVEAFDLTHEAEGLGTSTSSTVDDDVAQVISIFEEADPATVRVKLQR